MGVYIGNVSVNPSGISKVYVGNTLVYESGPTTPDATLKGGSASNALATYIKNNSITEVYIVDKSNLPSGTTDVTSSITNLTNGYAGVLGTILYLTGLSAGNIIYTNNNISYLFSSCTSLKSVDLHLLDTSKNTDASSMFYGCSGLKTANLSGWNILKTTGLGDMFYTCSALTTVDLTGWDTSNVKATVTMFAKCYALNKIYASRSWYPTYTGSITNGVNMFQYCSSLPGFDSSQMSYTKASLTTDPTYPGYMTYKE